MDNSDVKIIPGRPDRKLRERVEQIAAWRADGFSVADILRALAQIGVAASYSSVYREVQKLETKAKRTAAKPRADTIPSKPEASPQKAAAPSKAAYVDVDTFFNQTPSNPILDKIAKSKKP